jgi:hypothetical protein
MNNLFQVVADAQKADAILTERLGAAFEQKLAEMYPPPPPPAPPKEEKEEKRGDTAVEDAAKQERPVRAFSAQTGRGNVFLVGRESRLVLWSIYQPPKSAAPDELNKAAEKVVVKLRETLAGK